MALLALVGACAVLGCSAAQTAPSNGTPTVATDSGSPGTPALGIDASLHGRRPFPSDNPWNVDVSAAAVDPNSSALIASCGNSGLHPDFGTVWDGAPNGIPYVVVSGTEGKVPVSFMYTSESDPGPYPLPPGAPIEGGPSSSGDRHVLVVDRDNWKLYELFDAHPVNGGERWTAGSGAVFDLASNALRPAGWTSADAAGLPIFPGLVRYDEAVEQSEIRHALRFTCPRTRRAYVAPATHWASSSTDASLPPMGMRVRLRADFDVSTYPSEVRVILRAMQRYGMLLADNGSGWYVSGAPDPRWSDDKLATLSHVRSSDFQVVRMGQVVTQ
ncbi:MAG TPA: hypothetical protein VGQ56_02110 [Gemmatimonadaceae bacterium]|jgi:hypothetical protein|nr:hypothetical protein [Gemmatimonadaceae bacterium]